MGSTSQGEDEDEPRKEVQRGSFFCLIRFPSVKNCIWVGKSYESAGNERDARNSL